MLDKRYDFQTIETRHAGAWEQDGCYNTIRDGRPPFAIMMPPPNVTGTLHLGHALDNTLPDILIRRARMQGKDALYQPGTDHASIAVHVVLERQWAKTGQTRFDFGREQFLEKAWEWKDHSAGIITGQIRRLGISCDWQNERFTMDPAYVKAVNKAFIELYERGLIYRGQRLVNWDPKMQTAVSDLEVKHKEVQGNLWHVAYRFADGFSHEGQDHVVVATTRPETILADGAIAIHPDDARAAVLVGKKVLVPLVERAIEIVADEMVDPAFGSGMVKITAAHDFNDFAFYQRHKDSVEIPLINLLTPDGRMNGNAPEAYQGMDRFAARKQVVADLEAAGLLVKAEAHAHNVGHAERDDTILEPYLTQQWYIDAKPLAKRCLEALARGDISFVNSRDEKIYRHWLENIQDWCISRQLWWGHRIPAWYRDAADGTTEIAVSEYRPAGDGWVQDEDILDTWFSSGLWPFATQGWPQEGERQRLFYPGAAIMSGRDILPFWIIRMLMMGLELTDQAPFKQIYTHGLILDEHGQKMSKSKGNVLDPMEMINEYGADALRFTMAAICSSEDMRFSKGKMEQHRNFCTKLWNAARFMMMQDVRHTMDAERAFNIKTVQHPVNQWIIGSLKTCLQELDDALDKFDFARAASVAYHFTWGTWCDWYLELTKPMFASGDAQLVGETRAVMGWAFDKMLRMLHPFIPFVTEEIWQQLSMAPAGHYLMNQRWPVYAGWPVDTRAVADVQWLVDLVSGVRQARTIYKLAPKTALRMLPVGERGQEIQTRLKVYGQIISQLAGVEFGDVRLDKAGRGEATLIVQGTEYVLPLEGLVDFVQEHQRLKVNKEKLGQESAKIEALMNNSGFLAKAPAEVLETNRARQQALAIEMHAITDLLNGPYRLAD